MAAAAVVWWIDLGESGGKSSSTKTATVAAGAARGVCVFSAVGAGAGGVSELTVFLGLPNGLKAVGVVE